MKTIGSKLFLAMILTTSTVARASDRIDYPDGYRLWAHVKTLVLHKGHPLENPFKGIHHVYANLKAVEGVKSGRFDDGSVLVFDLFEFNTKEHASAEGKRVLLGVMRKDEKRFPATGGWGFEGFAGDSRDTRLVSDGGKSCFSCHRAQRDHGYVFSRWRD